MTKVIEFTPALRLLHKPKPQPVAVADAEEEKMAAVDLVQHVVDSGAAKFSVDVMVLLRDANNEITAISNLGSEGETLLILEQTKTKLLEATMDKKPTPPRTA